MTLTETDQSLQGEGRESYLNVKDIYSYGSYNQTIGDVDSDQVVIFHVSTFSLFRVEWGSQFSINVSKPTVMPCRGSFKLRLIFIII